MCWQHVVPYLGKLLPCGMAAAGAATALLHCHRMLRGHTCMLGGFFNGCHDHHMRTQQQLLSQA